MTSLGLAMAGTGGGMSSADMNREYCQLGGSKCNHIGVTEGYFRGHTLDFVYTKPFYCKEPPSSKAGSHCEAGKAARREPPKATGAVESPIWAITPVGFTPPNASLQCPVAGHCIDHPRTIDLTRVFGSGYGNVPLPPHSHVIVEREHGLSVWWPLRVVGVTNPDAWNALKHRKSLHAVRLCQDKGNCTDDIVTNNFLFFAAGTRAGD